MPMILVVDDEPMIRALVAEVLQKEGFSVLAADSGADAISIARSHRGEIRLLITDIMMLGMDGWALARQLTADDPDIPVLFMSGQCDASELDQYERSRFLAKPFSLVALLTEVRNLMHNDMHNDSLQAVG